MQIKLSAVGNCVWMKAEWIFMQHKNGKTKLTQKYGNSGEELRQHGRCFLDAWNGSCFVIAEDILLMPILRLSLLNRHNTCKSPRHTETLGKLCKVSSHKLFQQATSGRKFMFVCLFYSTFHAKAFSETFPRWEIINLLAMSGICHTQRFMHAFARYFLQLAEKKQTDTSDLSK